VNNDSRIVQQRAEVGRKQIVKLRHAFFTWP